MNRNIQYIILLVFIANVGLLVSQVYWLRSSFMINQERFEQEVKTSLDRAVEQVLVGHTRNVLLGNEQGSSDRTFILTDTIRAYPSNFSQMQGDSTKPKLSISTFITSDDTRTIPDNLNSIQVTSTSQRIDDIFSDSNEVSIFVDKVLSAFVEKKIDLQKLDSFYRLELANLNIETDYYLRLLRKDSLIGLTTSLPDDTDATLATEPLAESTQMLPPDYKLQALFPNQTLYIFQKMGLLLLASLLLVGITLGSFLFMLRVIFKQKKLSEVKNDFINNMTHELKTPIAVLSAANEALTNFNALDDRAKTLRYLDIFKRELERLTTMVEKVLNISIYEKETFQLKKEPVHVPELIRNLIDRHQISHNGTLEINYENHLAQATLPLDKVHFHNVLNNLIDNAIKYSQTPKLLNITTHTQARDTVISVQDNGIGISKANQKTIFDKFYRVPTGDVHTVKGFGLGLSYVKRMVEQHGGTIEVDSTLGQGSTFTIRLPHEEN